MVVAVGSSLGNPAFAPEIPETQGQLTSTDSSNSSLQLPNVFVTPPEEEFDSPPWCCFDADKDAQPGAFVYDEFQQDEQDFDYAAHAEDEIFGQSASQSVVESPPREDVFVMHSLMQEAEHLKKKLKSLDLSAAQFSFTAPSPAEDEAVHDIDELIDTPTSQAFAPVETVQSEPEEQRVKRRKSLFTFRPLARRKSFEGESESAGVSHSPIIEGNIGGITTNGQDMEVISIRSGSSRKTSFFSRFKLSSRKSATSLGQERSDSMNSTNACRSQEELLVSQEQEMVVKRRFSIFDIPRRSFSASQSTSASGSAATPTSIVPSMNQSNSSLSSASVPPTPDAATCNVGVDSPLASPTEKSTDRLSSIDTSFLSRMDVNDMDNIASSLTIPASRHAHVVVPDHGQFSLDPLHFESLQFNSDDFA